MIHAPSLRRFLVLSLLVVFATAASAQTPAPVPAAAAPPPPPPGWTGSFGAGFALAKGNSDTSHINASYDTKRDTGSNVLFKSSGLFLRGESDGTVDTNRLGLDGRVDRKLSTKTSIYGQMQYLHDEFKEIDYLLSPTVGIGYQVVKSATTEFAVDAGVGVVWEKNPGRDVDVSGALTAGEHFKHTLTKTTEVTEKFAALWKTKDFDDSLFTFGVGLAASVTSMTQLKFELLETYKNKPPTAETQKSDLAVLISFVFKY